MEMPSLQPYISVQDAERAIDVYSQVFGMTEVYRLPMGDKVGHAELKAGNCRLLLASEFPEGGHKAPPTLGGTPPCWCCTWTTWKRW